MAKGARVDLVELRVQLGSNVADLLAKLGELLGRNGLIVDRGFGLIQCGLVIERGHRRGRDRLRRLLRKSRRER